MKTSILGRSAAILALIPFATMIAVAAGARERIPGPLPPCVDIKTAPEPSTLPPFVPQVPASAGALPAPARPMERRTAQALPTQARRGVPHDRMYYDAPGDGSRWARGASFKMSFDARGATYYPWLGASAPRDIEIALSPDRVTSGGAELSIADEPRIAHGGDRVEIDRGAFVEVYELTPGSVEQSFVFSALPHEGDLVLHVPLTGEMRASTAADGIELTSDLGRVLYGHALAIDARGRRAEVALDVVDGAVTLRVGGEFLASATLPLVIDPLVTTFPIAVGANNDYGADAAYDATNQCWLVVYEEVYSATDRDVYAELLTATGAFIAGGYADFTGLAWDHASCANLAVGQQFLVAAGVTNGTAKTINGRTIQASNLSMSSQFAISNGEFGSLVNPDVGGDPYFGQSYYCVVYQRTYSATDEDIIVRLVDGSGATAVGPVYLSNSGGTQDIFPSISKSDGSSSWAIAWQRNVNDSSTGIWAGRISWNGSISASPFQIINYPYAYIPSVSSPLIGSQRNMIAYEAIMGGASGNTYDIRADVIDGGVSIWSLDVNTNEFPDHSDRDQIEPQVDSDGQHFAVMYTERAPGSTYDFDVFVTDIGMTATNAFVSGSRTALSSSTNPEHGPQIASAHGSGGPAYRYMAVWQMEVGAADDVLGALYDGSEGGRAFGFCFGDGGSSSTPCPCGNNGSLGNGCASSTNPAGAGLYAYGSLSTVHDTTVLSASGLPPTAAALFFQAAMSLSPSIVFGDGLRCINGSVVRLGVENASGGFASYPGSGETAISVRGGIPIDGITGYYQCWYRNSASFCTSSTFNLTNAVFINWGR